MADLNVLNEIAAGLPSPGSVTIATLDNPGWQVDVVGVGGAGFVPQYWRSEGAGAVVSYWRAAELSLALSATAQLFGRTSEPSAFVDLVVRWYLALCDGDWEHTYGVEFGREGTAWRVAFSSDGILPASLVGELRAAGCELKETSDQWVDEWQLRFSVGDARWEDAEATVTRLLDFVLESRG